MTARSRRSCATFTLLLLVQAALSAVPDPTWPNREAGMVLRIIKKSGFELETEPQWMHLHVDTSNPAAQQLGLTIQVLRNQDGYSGDDSLSASGIQVRYTVMGVPISRWLNPGSWDLTLSATSAALYHLKDGVLDISLEVTGADRMQYKPWPAFLHLKRNQPLSPLVPIMMGDHPNMAGYWMPDVVRIDRSDRLVPVTAQNDGKVTTSKPSTKLLAAAAVAGYPASPSLTPWSDPPYEADLYVELLSPGGGLFEELQMWWEDLPSHPGLHFIRGLQPYQGEDPRGIDHRPLPVQDGPRGRGWISSYIAGKVDSRGRLAFAELSGRVGWLLPDGTIATLAGWVTSPGYNPVWVRKDLTVIRRNQQLRGQWPEESQQAAQGFGRPMDVAFDPAAPDVLFVPDLVLHCIWRVEVLTWAAGAVPQVQVSLFAGSATGESGFADGSSSAARFNEPYSVAWAREAASAGEAVLYVSDSANHAVRRVRVRDRSVSTVWGGPGVVDRITTAGIDPFERAALRATLHVTVSPSEAAAGTRPDIYWPSAIRTDSQGNIILMEHGFGQIRRLNPSANTAVVLATVDQKFGEWDHGWAWLDVDTTGSAGPVDGIYWCKAVGDTIQGDEGSHFNEVFAWVPKEGGGSRFIFPGRGGGANPIGFGERNGTTPPHYPWLVAVDPLGGLLMTGMGVHGVSRLRVRDPVRDPTATEDWLYWQGQELYRGVGSLCFRYGFGTHNLLQLGLDGWSTQDIKDNATLLLDYYSVPASIASNTDASINLLRYLSKQAGPVRDGIPTAPPDTQPPTVPTLTAMAAGTFSSPSSILLKWSLSKDDRAVAGYELQLVRGPSPSFTTANAVAGYFDVAVGNTEVVLLEGLRRGVRYHARLRARDLGGRASSWSAVRSLRLP